MAHRLHVSGRLPRGGGGCDFDRRGPHGKRGSLSRGVHVAASLDSRVPASRTQTRDGNVTAEFFFDGSVDGAVPAPAVPTAAPTNHLWGGVDYWC